MKKATIVLHLQGGIGNQLFQLARVLEAGGKTLSTLYICLHRAASTASLDELIDLDKLGKILEVNIRASSRFGITCVVDKILFSLSVRAPLVSEILRKVGFPSNFGSESNLGIKSRGVNFVWGFFQRNFPNEITLSHLRTALRCPTSLVPGETVAHFRGGDFSRTGFGVLSAEYYVGAMRKCDARNNLVFVGQSTRARAELLKSHTFRETEITSNEDVLEDFQRLLRASMLVCSNSSFSWWAAALKVECSTVVVPVPWSQDEGVLNFPVKADWQQVKSTFETRVSPKNEGSRG